MGKIAIRDEDFYLPNSKEGRKTLLKQIISKHLTPHWLQMPKQRANMERRFLRRLIETI